MTFEADIRVDLPHLDHPTLGRIKISSDGEITVTVKSPVTALNFQDLILNNVLLGVGLNYSRLPMESHQNPISIRPIHLRRLLSPSEVGLLSTDVLDEVTCLDCRRRAWNERGDNGCGTGTPPEEGGKATP